MKRSTFIPLLLLLYLAVMSYVGLPEYYSGNYFYYFGVIGVTLALIVILHLFLRRREHLRERRNPQQPH